MFHKILGKGRTLYFVFCGERLVTRNMCHIIAYHTQKLILFKRISFRVVACVVDWSGIMSQQEEEQDSVRESLTILEAGTLWSLIQDTLE